MSNSYDVVVVGGGIAGSSLAYCLAKAGARVLVLEAETEFKDRVRGEVLCPWGVAEAEMLGVLSAFREAGAREVRWLDQYMGAQQIEHRDFPATTLTKTPLMTWYHPKMQTSLLNAAEAAGAEVRRGATVNSVTPGRPPRIAHRQNGGVEEVTGRLIVIADGRNSGFRRMAGFEVQRENQTLCIAGVLLDGVPLAEDTFHMFTNPALGEITVWAPQGGGRGRAYLCHWSESRKRLQGDADLSRFIGCLEWTGSVAKYFSAAKKAGPLATFDGADNWVEHPYREGVALLGDAAASSDPTWGQGLALSLRGTRIVRDALLGTDDWDAAGHQYAREQNKIYEKIRTVTSWFREFFLMTGASADARRAGAFPLFAQDPTRVPDLLFSGPDIPLHANSRARFFGEDAVATTKAQAN